MTFLNRVSKPLFLLAGFLFAGSASAAQLVPVVEVANSVQYSTSPIGINDMGVITGSYVGQDTLEHGFVGTADGMYTVFDAGPNGTEPRAINNSGLITGLSNASGGNPVLQGVMFEANASLAITPIMKGGVQMLGIPQGLNNTGEFVGGYATGGTPKVQGFYGFSGQWMADLAMPFTVLQTRARAINNSGEVVGLFYTFNGTQSVSSGFVVKNGVVTVVNYPDPTATGTNFEGVNDQGVISGSYNDASGNSHSFVLAPDLQTYTLILIPGSSNNQAWGINNGGEVVISSDVGPFIYCSLNGHGHCRSGHAKVAATATVHGGFHTFNCINACHNSVRGGPTVQFVDRPIDLHATPFKRPQ
jgi:hypothetical protein